jgi:hypothetical protein
MRGGPSCDVLAVVIFLESNRKDDNAGWSSTFFKIFETEVLLLVSVPDLQGRLDVLGHLHE